MKPAELAHYRAILQAQAVEPPRRGIFASKPKMAVAVISATRPGAVSGACGPPPQRLGSLFGRRPPEPQTPSEMLMAKLTETLVLDTPVEPAARLRLRAAAQQRHLAETPYHAEDLADPPSPSGPTPGVIAGWSSVKPPSAQLRLLRRLGAVIEAERQGLAARLAAAGVEPA